MVNKVALGEDKDKLKSSSAGVPLLKCLSLNPVYPDLANILVISSCKNWDYNLKITIKIFFDIYMI